MYLNNLFFRLGLCMDMEYAPKHQEDAKFVKILPTNCLQDAMENEDLISKSPLKNEMMVDGNISIVDSEEQVLSNNNTFGDEKTESNDW